MWLGALAVTLASGCGATRPSKYYQLTVPGDLAPVADPRPFPVTLLLGPLRASHLYREDHIVYSSNGESIFKELMERIIANTCTPWKWERYTPYNNR